MSNIKIIKIDTLTNIGNSIKKVMGDNVPPNFTISDVPNLIEEIAQNYSSKPYFCLKITLKSGGISEEVYTYSELTVTFLDSEIPKETMVVGDKINEITKSFIIPKGTQYHIEHDSEIITGTINQNSQFSFRGPEI